MDPISSEVPRQLGLKQSCLAHHLDSAGKNIEVENLFSGRFKELRAKEQKLKNDRSCKIGLATFGIFAMGTFITGMASIPGWTHASTIAMSSLAVQLAYLQ